MTPSEYLDFLDDFWEIFGPPPPPPEDPKFDDIRL